MSITPLSRSYNTNWLNLHNKHCNDISNSNYSTLLTGDSLIVGLSCYANIWRRYFKPLNAINCGIGGDRIQNVLWRSNNLPSSPSFQNAVILCGTNNIQRDSSEDIVDGILEIALTLRRKYNHLHIVVCGLLPRDENWPVNQIYIREINDYLSYKCDWMARTLLNQMIGLYVMVLWKLVYFILIIYILSKTETLSYLNQ